MIVILGDLQMGGATTKEDLFPMGLPSLCKRDNLYIFNRPGEAGAVLQAPLLLIN